MAIGFDGSIRIDTKIDTNGFNAGTRAITGGLQSVTVGLGKLGRAVGIAFGVGALIRFGQQCIEVGSDIAEVQNVVDTAFGDMAYMVEDFAKRSIDQFGLSELQAKRTASTYMAMSKGLGLAGRSAAQMSINVAGLTGDVASFYNVSQEIADTALKSIWTGETESLKQFGVVMTQANLQQFAYTQGIRKKISAMSQAELVQLRYLYVTDQLALAQGDFAKTSASWANQVRILTERFRELMGILGNGLIAALTPAVQFLNVVIAKLISFANTVYTVIAALFGRKSEQQSVAAGYDATASAIGDAAGAADDLTESTKAAGAAAKKSLAVFDELNVLPDNSGSSSSSGGVDAGAFDITPVDYSAAVSTLDAIDERMLAVLQEWKEAAQPTVEAFQRLWSALEPLKNFSSQALIDFYEHFLKPVGVWVLGEGLPRFVDAITNGLEKIKWDRLNASLVTLWDALAPFAINVGEGLLWLWENVLVPIGTWTVNEILPRYLELISAGLDVLNAVIEAAKPCLQYLWDEFLKPLAVWTGGAIVAVLDEITDCLKKLADLISGNVSFSEFIDSLNGDQVILLAIAAAVVAVNAALFLYNTYMSIAAAVTLALEGSVVLVVAVIASLITIILLCIKHWDDIKAAGGAAVDFIKEKWKSAGGWFHSTVVDPISKFFSNLWSTVKSTASDAWTGIQTVFHSAATWFSNTVISPIKTAFKSAINFLIGLAEGFANGFIKGINGIISALNKISITIPSWIPEIGGKHFGINIPKVSTVYIPRLATGAVIPPNQQFMAVLGDQTHGRNLEAPEGLIRQIFREENDTTELLFVLRDILDAVRAGKVLMVDRKTLAQVVTAEQAAAVRTSGRNPIPV